MSTHLPAHRETIVEEDLTHHCARPSNEQEQGYWDSLKPHETSSATSQVSSSVIPSATSSPFVAAGSVHGPVEDSFLHEAISPLACGHSIPMASSLQCDDSLFSLHSQFCNYQQQQQ
ncbi:unnamed protein product [Sphagnum balticum]